MEKAGISVPVLVWIVVCALHSFLLPFVIAFLRVCESKTQYRIIAWSYSLFWSLCCGVCFWFAWNHTPREYLVIAFSSLAFLALLLFVLLFQLDKRELVRSKRRHF